MPPKADVDAHAALRAEPHPLAPRLARHVGARAGRDLDVLVLLPRARADPRPLRDGLRRRACTRATSRSAGSPRTSRAGSSPSAASSCEWMPRRVDEYETLVDRNKIWLERTKGSGCCRPTTRSRSASPARCCARSGVDWDLRKRRSRTSPTTEVDFDVPVYYNGDVYDRYRVHMDEMRESTRIVAQCLDRLERMEGEPWIADDRKVVLPPREELHTSMESLIHHFKIVTEGYRVPEGEVYVADRVAARRARLLRRLRRRPEAVAREVPRPVVRRARGDRDLHARRADRRHDRDRRLARHRHGRGRPVTARCTTRSRRCARRYPGARARPSMPALRLAQERVRLAVARGVPRGRRRARPDARVLPCRSRGSTTCSSSSPSASTRRGLHERLLRARRRAAACSRRSSASSASRRRDDRRRRDHAARGRVPRRLRLGDGRRGRHRYRQHVSRRRARRSSRSCAVTERLERSPRGRRRARPDEARGVPAVGGYEAVPKARAMTPDAVIDELLASDLRGRGGAGFPTGRKASSSDDREPEAEVPRRQRRRVGAGQLQGPRDHGRACRTA